MNKLCRTKKYLCVRLTLHSGLRFNINKQLFANQMISWGKSGDDDDDDDDCDDDDDDEDVVLLWLP